MDKIAMKVRDSGMPEEPVWEEFFEPEEILRKLGLGRETKCAVEFGCGYGTFTVAAARIISGTVHGFDIDPTMIESTRQKAEQQGLTNISLYLRDFIAEGTGLEDNDTEYVMMFNILHGENPRLLLDEAFRVLCPDGTLAVIHWNYDPQTPRGPAIEIRPKPDQLRTQMIDSGFRQVSSILPLPPHHYGIIGKK